MGFTEWVELDSIQTLIALHHAENETASRFAIHERF
jgi:hypothetical protein